MAKEKVSVESLVDEALRKLATADGPLRLSGKGDPPALFASAAGANKDAIAQLQDAALIRVEGKNSPVKLTAAGFARVLPGIPEEKVGGLAKAFAADIPTAAARVEFLQEIVGRTPTARAELLTVLDESLKAESAETEARLAAATKRRERDEADRDAAARWIRLIDDARKKRVAALLRELEIEGEKVDAPPPTPAPPAPSGGSKPVTPADHGFRRDTADQLTSAWRAAWDDKKADAREYLESAIWNVRGFRTIGEAGQQIPFDGRLHEGGAGLFTGDAVRVVRPGWLIEEDDREYVALKALVEK